MIKTYFCTFNSELRLTDPRCVGLIERAIDCIIVNGVKTIINWTNEKQPSFQSKKARFVELSDSFVALAAALLAGRMKTKANNNKSTYGFHYG